MRSVLTSLASAPLCMRKELNSRVGHLPPFQHSGVRVMVSRGDLHPHMGFEPWERPDTPHIPKVLSSIEMKVPIFEQTNVHIHLDRDWTSDLLNESPASHLETTNSQFTNTYLHATKLPAGPVTLPFWAYYIWNGTERVKNNWWYILILSSINKLQFKFLCIYMRKWYLRKQWWQSITWHSSNVHLSRWWECQWMCQAGNYILSECYKPDSVSFIQNIARLSFLADLSH